MFKSVSSRERVVEVGGSDQLEGFTESRYIDRLDLREDG